MLSPRGADLAALALLRIAAEESEGPGRLTGRMRLLVQEMTQSHGPDSPAEVAIALARRHFALLDSVAEALNYPVDVFLEAGEKDLP